MTRDLDSVLALARDAAVRAGEAIRARRANAGFGVTRKDGERNLVTDADLEAEAVILEYIRKSRPGDAILSEESQPSVTHGLDGPLWIIDPVDGTTNFAHGHAHVGVSIAFADEGKLQVGVVHAPFLCETFTAIRGRGAWLDGASITCSRTEKLVDALVGTGFPYERTQMEPVLERVRRVLGACRDLRRAGAASLDLCWTACGRLDAFYESLMPWDMAAGGLIAREAGARVGHTVSTPPSLPIPEEIWGEELLVASPALYPQLERLLNLAG